MQKDFKPILAVAAGSVTTGAALKLTKNADGTIRPLAALIAVGAGVALIVKGPSPVIKALGYGVTAVGALGVVSKIAEKVPVIGKFTPGINGINGQFVEDENGNTYMIEGINGDEYGDEEMFFDEESGAYLPIEGLNGEDAISELIAA